MGFPRGSVSLVGLELNFVILPISPESGAVGSFLSFSVLSKGAPVGLNVALKGGEVTCADETAALPGFPLTLFGGNGFLCGGTGLGGMGGRRVPGLVAVFLVEWVLSTDSFLPTPHGGRLTPVSIPFHLGFPLGLGLLGLVLFKAGLICSLSGILGLTGVVYNLCDAGVVFASSVVRGILVVKRSWTDWSVTSRTVCSSS